MIIIVKLTFGELACINYYFSLQTGSSIWHFALDIVAVYFFLVILGPTLLTLVLTWILTMVCYCLLELCY